MPVSIEALGIDRLTVRERLELIEQIWDSLPEHVQPDEIPIQGERRSASPAMRGRPDSRASVDMHA